MAQMTQICMHIRFLFGWCFCKSIFCVLFGGQGCHGDGRSDTSVRPSGTSDEVLVRQIRVNAMLTSDKVKPELLCPRWLPRCCHVGWLNVSFHYIARAAEHIVLWRARMAAIGARMATEWGAHR
jgi:hypothetical protein